MIGETKYYLIVDGLNIARVEGSECFYLDKTTGRWLSDPSVFRHVSGIGGDADTHEITRSQALEWVAKNCPDLAVDRL